MKILASTFTPDLRLLSFGFRQEVFPYANLLPLLSFSSAVPAKGPFEDFFQFQALLQIVQIPFTYCILEACVFPYLIYSVSGILLPWLRRQISRHTISLLFSANYQCRRGAIPPDAPGPMQGKLLFVYSPYCRYHCLQYSF